jgi:hypothetical protein
MVYFTNLNNIIQVKEFKMFDIQDPHWLDLPTNQVWSCLNFRDAYLMWELFIIIEARKYRPVISQRKAP